MFAFSCTVEPPQPLVIPPPRVLVSNGVAPVRYLEVRLPSPTRKPLAEVRPISHCVADPCRATASVSHAAVATPSSKSSCTTSTSPVDTRAAVWHVAQPSHDRTSSSLSRNETVVCPPSSSTSQSTPAVQENVDCKDDHQSLYQDYRNGNDLVVSTLPHGDCGSGSGSGSWRHRSTPKQCWTPMRRASRAGQYASTPYRGAASGLLTHRRLNCIDEHDVSDSQSTSTVTSLSSATPTWHSSGNVASGSTTPSTALHWASATHPTGLDAVRQHLCDRRARKLGGARRERPVWGTPLACAMPTAVHCGPVHQHTLGPVAPAAAAAAVPTWTTGQDCVIAISF